LIGVTVDTRSPDQANRMVTGMPPPAPGAALEEMLLWVLAAGFVLRLLWLAAGCARLARYRASAVAVPDHEGVLQSSEVVSPVTFGIFRRVVLVPATFFRQAPEVQRAVLCHEFLHVRRRDALWTLIEEFAGALVWFHPAVWWVLGRVRLSREQAVDEEAVRVLGARETYVGALLAAAGAPMQFDVAPATLFMRRRHLFHRVTALMEGKAMSKRQVVTAASASAAVLMVASVLAVRTFPLQAEPQVQAAPAGSGTLNIETPYEHIRVDTGGVPLPYPPRAIYPPEARAKKVEGTVFLQLRVGDNGQVIDAVVQSGPDELRATSLQSALVWRFGKEAAGKTVQASVDYRLKNAAAGRTGGSFTGPPPPPPPPPIAYGLPAKIFIAQEIAEPLRSRLDPQLKALNGRAISDALFLEIDLIVRPLLPGYSRRLDSSGNIFIGPPGAAAGAPPPGEGTPGGPKQIRVGGAVQAARLTNYTPPEYPPLARQARIQGTVRFNAVIAKDGTVAQITLVSGHPLLVPFAQESVRGYVYQTTLLNGEPVEVVTTIDVPFTLPPE
jgi:protein TonB